MENLKSEALQRAEASFAKQQKAYKKREQDFESRWSVARKIDVPRAKARDRKFMMYKFIAIFVVCSIIAIKIMY